MTEGKARVSPPRLTQQEKIEIKIFFFFPSEDLGDYQRWADLVDFFHHPGWLGTKEGQGSIFIYK